MNVWTATSDTIIVSKFVEQLSRTCNLSMTATHCWYISVICGRPEVAGDVNSVICLLLLVQPEMCESISLFMANTHQSVNEMSQTYLLNERRYNYTTPKSFLEQIKLYQNLLKTKNDELIGKTQRLENGLEKINSASTQVSWFLNATHVAVNWGPSGGFTLHCIVLQILFGNCDIKS